jgi:hypothetical protein
MLRLQKSEVGKLLFATIHLLPAKIRNLDFFGAMKNCRTVILRRTTLLLKGEGL